MQLTPAGYAFLGIILFSFWITRKIAKRRNTKLGCIGFGYIALVVFCISMFAATITYITFDFTAKKTDILINSKSYTAEVIDFQEKQSIDSEGISTTSYYPILKFTTEDGQVLTRTSTEVDMAHKHIIRETRTVYYHEKKDLLTTIGAMTFISIIGIGVLCLVFVTLFIGVVIYGVGLPMAKYFKFCSNIGFKFLIPLLMIAFDALLIYGFCYGNTSQAWYVKPILILFIIGLSLGTLGYLKMIIKKGTPTFKRVSATRWEGDWEDDE